MEKLEKFEFVFRYAQRLGLKPQEMGEYFLSKAKEPSFVPNPLVNVGQFCYDDKTFSTDLIEQKTVSGIVSYVERKRALIVGLRSIELPWSSDFLQVCETRNLTDGKKATRLILEKAAEKNLKAEAAQWCFDFNQDGVQKGEAFLASLQELRKISHGIIKINGALVALNASPMSYWYWSSTESTDNRACSLSATGVLTNDRKNQMFHFVRPVYWVEL